MSRRKTSHPILFGGSAKGPHWMPEDEWIHTEEAFLHYVATVWVHQNNVPTERPELARFDIEQLRPEYDDFLKSGGRSPRRGCSVEELWLLSQLGIRYPSTCLLNTAQPGQPLGRVSRLRRLTATQIWTELTNWYANPALNRPLPDRLAGIHPITVCVYDGAHVAHVILAYTIWANELHFTDPWPDRSLLCSENNAAGVSARVSDLINPGWRITAEEFQRVVFAVLFSPHLRIELTEEERQAAEREALLMRMLRTVNKPGSRSIKDMIPESQVVSELEAAVSVGQMWRVKVALNKGLDVNEKGVFGTPLHIAAGNGCFEIVRLLVEQGADLSALNSDGKTAADVAAHNRHLKIAQYLRSLEKKARGG